LAESTDQRVATELEEIRRRLASLADDPTRQGVAEELGLLRAQLRVLGRTNSEVADRLAVSLGLRQPPRRGSSAAD